MKSSNKRYFMCSMMGTVCFLALITGFIVVEKNSRRVMFENDEPFFVCGETNNNHKFFKIRLIGKNFYFNF